MPQNRTTFQGLGGSSPYQRNIIVPRGGANEIGSQYTDLDENVIGESIGSFMDAFQQRKDARKQARLDRQEQALKIAELQGEITPELEEAILGPLQPEQPTLGGKLAGGLGRLIGIDTELGQPKAPFELTGEGGLKTKAERDAEVEESKFQRDLALKKFGSDLETSQKVEQMEKGVFVPGLTFEQEKDLQKLKNEGRKARGYANLKPKDKLKQDLYDGTVRPEDLTDKDFLILDKFWASMTPESQAQEALEYAENLVVAMEKGKVDKRSKEEVNQLIDDLASDYIRKLNRIVEESRGNRETGGRTGTSGRSLKNIMGGQ
jgi:hypothetical protein